jgi:hypothetical protein
MFTLFKSILGGLSWHQCTEPLAVVPAVWVFVFIVYICITMLAVLNVITGVFVETAIENMQNDRDVAVQKHLSRKKEYLETLTRLFSDIDNSFDNVITFAEFSKHLSRDESKAFFASLDIHADHAWEIFSLLDVDETGTVDLEEFVEGCLHLRGAASALDMMKLSRDVRRLDHMVVKMLRQPVVHQPLSPAATWSQTPSEFPRLEDTISAEYQV